MSKRQYDALKCTNGQVPRAPGGLAHLAVVLLLMAGPGAAEEPHGDEAHGDELHGDEHAQQLTLDTAPFRAEIALRCRFETECFEGEPCMDTRFAASLEGRAGGLTPLDMVAEVALVSDSGTETLLGLSTAGAYALAGGTFDARHMMTVGANGVARYSVHYAEGPMVITYLGRCE